MPLSEVMLGKILFLIIEKCVFCSLVKKNRTFFDSHPSIVEELLRRGASVGFCNNSGKTRFFFFQFAAALA